ncbi:hypothetical protein HPP92_003719 [Vanilla planifolia]|uniref:Major facilitator superfamily (MFS) profile domain-containing protein n=1 Tax=Vanilla planifolia TaxID=51239 RepID=A0A835VLS0_VANPL|nr:hypothetical protein HPP92_003719 [Vanilla planifolia]
MAPPKRRGMLNVTFQQMITIGILVANLINYFTAQIKGGFGVAHQPRPRRGARRHHHNRIHPSSRHTQLPGGRGKEEEAKAMLRRIRGVPNVDEEFDDLVAASRESKAVRHPWRNMLDRRYRPQLVMGFLLPLFQQLTGINVVMFYAPELFKIVGFSGNASLMSAVITGTVNVVATFVSVGTVDRYGRRFWLLQGGLQMLASQIAVGTMIASQFGTTGTGSFLRAQAIALVGCICVYVSGFAWSWGPLGWLVPSEIYPLEIRSAGQSITVAVNMATTFLVAQIFMTMLCHLKFRLFFFFSACLVVMLVFVYFFLPETKGVHVEEMTKVWKTHRFWDASSKMKTNSLTPTSFFPSTSPFKMNI